MRSTSSYESTAGRPVGRTGRPGDSGMVTAELAVALPVLAAVASLLITVVGAAGDVSRASDAARSGARSISIGTPRAEAVDSVLRLAPAGATVDISSDGTLVRVTVMAPSRQWGPLTLPAPDVTAVAALEPGIVP
jgi:hypothetical protein